MARTTLSLLRSVVSAEGGKRSAQELLECVRYIGQRLEESQPVEMAAGCTVRRVMHIIRTEYAKAVVVRDEELAREAEAAAARASAVADQSEEDQSEGDEDGSDRADSDGRLSLVTSGRMVAAPVSPRSGGAMTPRLEANGGALHHMLEGAGAAEDATPRLDRTDVSIKSAVLGIITELIDDLANLHDQIAESAPEFISSGETIMTLGNSRTVREFLIMASEKRQIEVIVAESAPTLAGHQLAAELAAAGVSTTVITDSAVFAMMATVSKVIVPAHAVMANGGIIGLTGCNSLALAAKRYSVPFVVVTGFHKLVPHFPHDVDEHNMHHSPETVLHFEESDIVDAVTVYNPVFDYVPPDHVDLFVSNFERGVHNPSYIYRLLAEFYSPEDHTLH
ncbi:translation initiation factor eIF-2B subunit beta [Thecamonas trahens ATCC 50062]|uniref:Translation initiation factor eIF2B subunit beta n=1 Tax=Thecamonas trahens ATCC 50062 TaxID=461836 RepID=A0A0L0DUI3_THETB|nr:translation initiation factor eIF-2B subunit beta [Thecamonas trahens ATCC 50062]KNC55118.1 translation initiation factor eIF-2B subunit beta [Thecamonas trahens ATCC 50062]|eukprot:XP_013753299.1 translation initiation factor eIF-2B subunit beta [Thecamonas trahens ATCC 50062]